MSSHRSAHLGSAAEKPQAFQDIGEASQAGPGSANEVLEPAPGSASERVGRRFGGHSPILLFGVAVLAGYALLTALAVGLGFLLIDALVPIHAIGHSDEAVTDWLASNRSQSLDDASYVGSSIGDIPFVPALVILTALAAAVMRRWRVFGFIVGAILVEVATYRVTSLIVHRDRPSVPRLDDLPVNQSYPSGHVAASVVVYVGLALLISPRLRSGWANALLWIVALALPVIVALSRMYRGMHHPIDVGVGILIGLASIAIALFATRAAVEAWRLRSEGARR
jgi:undecaprenyl-diphosphatase